MGSCNQACILLTTRGLVFQSCMLAKLSFVSTCILWRGQPESAECIPDACAHNDVPGNGKTDAHDPLDGGRVMVPLPSPAGLNRSFQTY